MPYITPQDIPETDDCRSLSIPASTEWLAFFGGALTTLLYTYNWEQTTGISIDDTIAKMQEIIDGFYDGCAPCRYSNGLRIVRIGIGGHLEELGDDGTWETPTGDYVIPPPDAREGGTPDDQICLAAKNAANVLRILYESWSESWASELTLDEAIAAAIAALVAIPAFFLFAPIAGAIAIAIGGLLEIMFEFLEFLTADLWDENFTNEIVCLFLDCASNTDGVVTFDWTCLNDKINARIDSFALTDEQLRLYGQIGYLMYFIGGTDGVNLAGSTTAITDDDCLFCEGCMRYDFTVSDEGWVADTYGTWVADEGWQLNLNPSAIMIGFDGLPFPVHVSSVSVEYYNSGGTGVMALYKNTGSYVPVTVGEPLLNGENEFLMYGVADTGEIPNIFFNANADTDAVVYIRAITICYI